MAKSSETYSDVQPDLLHRGSTLNLQRISKACSNSGCPTIYKSDRGTLVVQGYAVSAAQAGVDLSDGELLVEIPVDLLTQIAGAVH